MRFPPPAALAGVALVVASPASAQTVGVELRQGWSGYEGLSSPAGVAVGAHSPLMGKIFGLRAGYAWRSDGRSRTGFTCTGLVHPDDPCPEDVLDEEFDLRTLALGAEATLELRPDIDLRVGVDRTWNRVEGSAVGRSTGREIRPHVPDGTAEGWAASVDVRWRPFAWRRLNLVARGQWEDAGIQACATDSWTPFCGDESFRSLGLGLEVDLARF